jgi:hypothetical protein
VVAPELIGSLLRQGDAWINLLVGTESTQVLLTPEGLVAAGGDDHSGQPKGDYPGRPRAQAQRNPADKPMGRS